MNSKATYQELFFLFLTGSILGFILEGVWRVIRTGTWENHSATVYGPFCIIYGFGAAALYWVSGYVSRMPLWLRFLLFAVVGGAVEYIGSLVQEKLLGSISWDYSDRFLNIHGRICLSMTIMWGLLGTTYSLLFVPAAENFFFIASDWPTQGLCLVLSVGMAVNLLISAAAVFRWHERQQDIPAKNTVEERLDKVYGDERMERVYNNMVFVENTPEEHKAAQ